LTETSAGVIITGEQLRNMLLNGARRLEANQQEINSLNVFPVPDGDTGTNMSLTAKGAAQALSQLINPTVSQVAITSGEASLMAARGNSGVILSQFLRGLARSLGNKDTACLTDIAKAFQYGLVFAYQAVSKPVEGTILTVAREMARGTRGLMGELRDLTILIEHALEHGYQALERTPEQLPILKEAGVVDAGARGLLFFLEGCWEGLSGRTDGIAFFETATVKEPPRLEEPELLYRYCTEALVSGSDLNSAAVQAQLLPLGDSLMVVQGNNIIKVHIHTNHPGRVLEILLENGTLHDIKIDNMADQHRETLVQSGASDTEIIVVASGEGLTQIFRNLGATRVISGGETMNPSVNDFVQAAQRAARAIILPNSENIRLAAEQAAALVGGEVKVLPSGDLPQGLAAMLVYDADQDLQTNYQKMLAQLDAVQSGRITYAARSTTLNGLEINENMFLGFAGKELVSAANSLSQVTAEVVAKLADEDSELVTLLWGGELSENDARVLADELEEQFPALEFELKYGGQPHDYALLLVE